MLAAQGVGLSLPNPSQWFQCQRYVPYVDYNRKSVNHLWLHNRSSSAISNTKVQTIYWELAEQDFDRYRLETIVHTLATVLMTHVQWPSLKDCGIVAKALGHVSTFSTRGILYYATIVLRSTDCVINCCCWNTKWVAIKCLLVRK